MIYYLVVSCVNGITANCCQTFRTKSSAIKNAYKRWGSNCYNRVYVWVENVEQPKNNGILLDLCRGH